MRSDVACYLRDEAASIERRVGRLRVGVILAGAAVITPTAIITGRPGVAQTLVVAALWLLYAVAVDRWLASGRFAPSIGYLSTGLDAAGTT